MVINSAGLSGQLAITRCYYEGPISAYAGALCGQGTPSAIITDCFVHIISTLPGYTGGIVGGGSGGFGQPFTISNCIVNIDSATTIDNYAGLFVGRESTYITVQYCYIYSGRTITNNNVGGFFGYNCNNCTIIESYFYGLITGSSYSFFVDISGTNNATNTITNCFTTTNSFSGSSTYAHNGILRINYTTADNNSTPITSFNTTYWDISTAPPTLKDFKIIMYWSGYSSYTNIPVRLPCILKGSYIKTIDGEKLIELLDIGDKLITPTGTTEVLGTQKYHTNSVGMRTPFQLLTTIIEFVS